MDIASLDLDATYADLAQIQAVNPQRYEFQLLDRVIHMDKETRLFAGFTEVKEGDWWARGHVPGRPLFPGVLMIEAAAQLCSFVWHDALETEGRFLGFAAVDDVKYRGAVQAPCRFVMIGHCTKLTLRRTVANTQGYVDGKMVFEGTVTGMPV